MKQINNNNKFTLLKHRTMFILELINFTPI